MSYSAEQNQMQEWKVQSPEEPGWHRVITPDTHECKHEYVFRLNLVAGQSHIIRSEDLEMHPVLIRGSAELSGHPVITGDLVKFDSFYIPADDSVTVIAKEDCVFYVAGAKYEGIGEAHVTRYDRDLPIGDVHQIHGSGAGRREVMFTLSDKTPASRLICGLTWGAPGAWTSWPPHQHENDLEEVYCYFDMDLPKLGFHFSYLRSGETDECIAHPVYSGSFVGVPRGYHPTVATPGTTNAYFWVLAALTPESRSYTLAIEDPVFNPEES